MRTYFGIILFTLSIGCGSSTKTSTASGTGTLSGTVSGKSYAVADAAYVLAASGADGYSGTQANQQQLMVLTSDTPDLCARASNLQLAPGENLFVQLLSAETADGTTAAAIGGGTYTSTIYSPASESPPTGNSVLAQFFSLDSSCKNTLTAGNSQAASGSTNLTSGWTGTQAGGTFNFVVGSQADTISGSFSAHQCPLLTNMIGNLMGLSGAAIGCVKPSN